MELHSGLKERMQSVSQICKSVLLDAGQIDLSEE